MFEVKPETREFSQALKRFSAATYKVKGTHSYAAGYYESLLASMFDLMTKKQREQFLREMREAAVKHETLAQVAGVSV